LFTLFILTFPGLIVTLIFCLTSWVGSNSLAQRTLIRWVVVFFAMSHRLGQGPPSRSELSLARTCPSPARTCGPCRCCNFFFCVYFLSVSERICLSPFALNCVPQPRLTRVRSTTWYLGLSPLPRDGIFLSCSGFFSVPSTGTTFHVRSPSCELIFLPNSFPPPFCALLPVGASSPGTPGCMLNTFPRFWEASSTPSSLPGSVEIDWEGFLSSPLLLVAPLCPLSQ